MVKKCVASIMIKSLTINSFLIKALTFFEINKTQLLKSKQTDIKRSMC